MIIKINNLLIVFNANPFIYPMESLEVYWFHVGRCEPVNTVGKVVVVSGICIAN